MLIFTNEHTFNEFWSLNTITISKKLNEGNHGHSPRRTISFFFIAMKCWWTCIAKLAFVLYLRRPAPPIIHRCCVFWGHCFSGIQAWFCPFFRLNPKHNLCWRKPSPADIYIHLLVALFTNVTRCLCEVFITHWCIQTSTAEEKKPNDLINSLIAKKCVRILLQYIYMY